MITFEAGVIPAAFFITVAVFSFGAAFQTRKAGIAVVFTTGGFLFVALALRDLIELIKP